MWFLCNADTSKSTPYNCEALGLLHGSGPHPGVVRAPAKSGIHLSPKYAVMVSVSCFCRSYAPASSRNNAARKQPSELHAVTAYVVVCRFELHWNVATRYTFSSLVSSCSSCSRSTDGHMFLERVAALDQRYQEAHRRRGRLRQCC